MSKIEHPSTVVDVMDLHVSLVDRKNLTDEIYRQIRGAIVEGRVRPGDGEARPLGGRPGTAESADAVDVGRS